MESVDCELYIINTNIGVLQVTRDVKDKELWLGSGRTHTMPAVFNTRKQASAARKRWLYNLRFRDLRKSVKWTEVKQLRRVI